MILLSNKMISVEKNQDFIRLIFPSDDKYKRLRLLVILSPIFIASFDSGKNQLEFLKNTIDNSKFAYGLYPKFFESFDIDDYRKSYKDYQVKEDIYLNENKDIEFVVNPMDDSYLDSLTCLIDKLIIDENNLNYFLDYFSKIRNDIVINGRRSILANGIQGFYLSKYVVVWMIDLCDYLLRDNPDLYEKLNPIYSLSNNLKTISQVKSKASL